MEENVKNHVLTYSKGLSSVPSDLVCDDDSLEVCENMTLVDGEWKVVQKPEGEFTLDGELMLVHRPNGAEIGNYIYKKQESNEKWKLYVKGNSTALNGEYSEITSVVAIGNTLVVNTGEGLQYYLWKNSEYIPLGNKMPEADIKFSMAFCSSRGSSGRRAPSISTDMPSVSTRNDISSIVTYQAATDKTAASFTVNDIETFRNFAVGAYSELKKLVAKQSGFCQPFFVRYAYELHDGTYYMQSIPILMLPAFYKNINTLVNSSNSKINFHCLMYYSKLFYTLNIEDADNWKDIIKKVCVFVTDGIELIESELNWSTRNDTVQFTNSSDVTIKGIYDNKFYTKTESCYGGIFKPRQEGDILDDLSRSSIFYKVAELDLGTVSNAIPVPIKKNVVENLVTQERLVNSISGEDYYSRCSLYPTSINTFNRRLNLAGVKRGFYDGADSFMPYVGTSVSSHDYDVSVTIETQSGEKVVKRSITTTDIFSSNMWFYYPDARAKKVNINGTEFDLIEHTGLNGAYYLGGFPNGLESALSGKNADAIDNTPETLNNYLLQSEVDNPFVFNASGYVRVGQGEIIGLAGLTTALSQDAYKVATTIAFTTQGIWALQIDATGQYSQVTPPFSREVCTNTKSITMVDNAVFFVSEKGLMCITGTTEQGVICVSKQLHGNKTFMNFLLECEIAYDYTDNMLLLYNTGSANGWVYNIESGVWSVFRGSLENKAFKTAVADYPDYLVQNADYRVFSLMEEPYRVDDVNVYSGKMVSRPLKLDGSMFMKSLRQVKNMKVINNGGISVVIKCSNDLRNWKRMESIKGQAFKFFKIEYTFTNIKAVDSFAGTAVASQVRYTEKFR